jgi:iron complex outermembrane receptor protein
MTRIRYGAYLAGTCLLTLGNITVAVAQSAPPATAEDAVAPANPDTADIIVTAQRRSESLSRTPVSVSVLSSEILIKRAVTTEADLQSVSPGLTVRASTNSNQLNYAIRGQSLDAFSGTRPGVLPYFDEVQVGGGGGASAFYDLQSIQVLKGPQGTLFGRNATGGAVLFTTAKPSNEVEGYALGRVGNYDLRQVEGAINLPIVDDKIMMRVAGFYEKRDGFQRDIYNGGRAGNVNRHGFRGSLTIKPAEGIKNELVVDYYRAKGNSLVGSLYSLNPNGAVPLIALTNFGNAAQFDGIISAFVAGAGGPPNAGAGAAAAYAAANPNLDPGGLASHLASQKARGPYVVETNSPNQYRGRNLIISNITSFDIGENTQIRNVLGYTRIDSRNLADVDGTPYGIDDNGDITNRTRQFSEELQLVGKTFDNKLSYVTGVYFSSERNLYVNTGNILTFPIIASLQSYAAQNRNKTYAVYAQGTYDLSNAVGIEGLAVTGGIRYTDEKVSIETLPSDISFRDPPAAQATYQFNQSKSFKNVSWTLGIQEQLTPNVLLYAASRRSYRNGGYNNSQRPVSGPGTEGGNGYGRETVTDGEIGAKFSGRAGTMPVRANIALYQDWISDSQRVAYTLIAGSPAAVTVNVPRAKVRGVELDGSITPASWLQLGGAATFTDAKFTRNLVSIQGGTPVRFGTYPDTPKWTGTAYAEVTIPVSGTIAVTARSDVYAQTKTSFTSTGNSNPGSELPGYTLVNFRAGFEDTTTGWSLTANLKNAFKRTYYVGGIALGELFQTNTAVPGAPRTFLVEARYKF